MSTVIPTLRTERLVVRAPAILDFAAYGELMASPRSAYMGGPFDQRGAWLSFCHDVALWPLLGHGALMMDRLSDGTCIGQVGINHGPLFPEKELGWLAKQIYKNPEKINTTYQKFVDEFKEKTIFKNGPNNFYSKYID